MVLFIKAILGYYLIIYIYFKFERIDLLRKVLIFRKSNNI